MCIIDVLYNNHKDGQSTCNLVVEIKIVALNHSIHKLPTLKRLRNQHQSVKMAKHMNCDASDYSAKLNHISHVLATTDDENYSCATVISAGLTVLNNSIILTMTKSLFKHEFTRKCYIHIRSSCCFVQITCMYRPIKRLNK